ncbi:MAG TPA: hypothetical protein VF753_14720 [Terriglobales bacterium]
MKASDSNGGKQYRSVKILSLGNRRRGKHRELTDGILDQLKGLKPGMALEIPLDSVGGVDLADLRSAVHRAATAVDVAIETQSDEKNLYVWARQEVRQG